MEITPDNEERMKEIQQAHKALQHEFKDKTKKRKIQNGGQFLQVWKKRLDALHEKWDNKQNQQKGPPSSQEKQKERKKKIKKENVKKKTKTKKSQTELVEEQSDLAVKSCLVSRQQSHIQAIPLSFGLKRILVEDWEIINANSRNDDNDTSAPSTTVNDNCMVHALPAKVTIRSALSMYLKEKGIAWDGISKASSSSQKKTKNVNKSDCAKVTDTLAEENKTSSNDATEIVDDDGKKTGSSPEEEKMEVSDSPATESESCVKQQQKKKLSKVLPKRRLCLTNSQKNGLIWRMVLHCTSTKP